MMNETNQSSVLEMANMSSRPLNVAANHHSTEEDVESDDEAPLNLN